MAKNAMTQHCMQFHKSIPMGLGPYMRRQPNFASPIDSSPKTSMLKPNLVPIELQLLKIWTTQAQILFKLNLSSSIQFPFDCTLICCRWLWLPSFFIFFFFFVIYSQLYTSSHHTPSMKKVYAMCLYMIMKHF